MAVMRDEDRVKILYNSELAFPKRDYAMWPSITPVLRRIEAEAQAPDPPAAEAAAPDALPRKGSKRKLRLPIGKSGERGSTSPGKQPKSPKSPASPASPASSQGTGRGKKKFETAAGADSGTETDREGMQVTTLLSLPTGGW